MKCVTESIDVSRIIPTGPTYLRGTEEENEQLAESVKLHGILEPPLLREKGNRFAVIAGRRRIEAAQRAGLEKIEAKVYDCTDQEAEELELIENMQRKGLSPLEEADGLRQLVSMKVPIPTIASRIGKSPRHVYDRLALLGLIERAKDLLRREIITLGHAVLLARLKTAVQDKLMKPHAGLLQTTLLSPAGSKDPWAGIVAVPLVEFRSWVQRHVLLDLSQKDAPELFPAAVQAVATSKIDKAMKLTPITRDSQPVHDARPDGLLAGGRWRRADGQEGSKKCGSLEVGLVVLGEGQGEAFTICTKRTSCKTHYGVEIRDAAARKKENLTAPGASASGREQAAVKKHREAQAAETERQGEWALAVSELRAAAAAAVKKAKPSVLLPITMREYAGAMLKGWSVTNADGLMRFMAYRTVHFRLQSSYITSRQESSRLLRKLGVDVAKILAEAGARKAKASK